MIFPAFKVTGLVKFTSSSLLLLLSVFNVMRSCISTASIQADQQGSTRKSISCSAVCIWTVPLFLSSLSFFWTFSKLVKLLI